jgi:uncharacterized protein (TIGR00255 family)
MIKSMTAFASSEAEVENLTIMCELRSVNHRYCDISVKLPERLKFAEAAIRPLISSRLKRGKIECSLSYKKQSGSRQHIAVNADVLEALSQATSQIEAKIPDLQAFSALDVLNFPGIQQQAEANKGALQTTITRIVKNALGQLVSAREQEGSQLAILIEDRCRQVQALVESADKRLPEVLDTIRIKIKARLSELVIDPDFDRLEQEMVYLAQKLDVAEEIDRLRTHAQEVLNVLGKNAAVGRRLDFLMQEMNREANTLGSKSADKEMTQISINLKVLIEQMREQIQNIE